MSDIDKALEYGKKCYSFLMDGDVTPEEYDTAFLYSVLVAEKKRADNLKEDFKIAIDCGYRVTTSNARLEAENARLREALSWYANPSNYGMDDWGVSAVLYPPEYGNPGNIARQALTPSTPSHNGEIDPTHADYGSLNEWPS